jgi:oxygen-dependent protoporphyrinogen oxidase
MKTVIIGGGISGLSAAYYLSKAGIRPTLIEKTDRLGGIVKTEFAHGCILEGGPDSFMAAKPWLMELIRELGMADKVINSNDHLRKTYILKKGKLIPLPDGLMMMVPTKIMPLVQSPLLSWGCKIRMGLEMLRRPTGKRPDRSVHDFLVDHYGEEALDYLAEPLLAGVYGGDPKQMSVNSTLTRFVEMEEKYGSLSRGTLAAPKPKGSGSGGSLFRTLRDGLSELIDKLAPKADVIHGRAEGLSRRGQGFCVRVNGDWIDADQVIVATPAYVAADLLKPETPEIAAILDSIPYSSSATVSLGYRKESFDRPLNGFGFLIPKKERRTITACTWVNNKFSGRAADGVVLLRCFLGGDAINDGDQALLAKVREDLQRIMGVRAEPFFHSISRWPRSMAQFTVGHQQRIAELEQRNSRLPGLYVIGNGYQGVGLPDCVKMGKDAAAKVISTAVSVMVG